MKLVIDIDENVFTRLFDNGTEDYGIGNDDIFTIAKSIRNGTPLPKGHGRLIDADALWKKWVFDAIGKQEIDEAPTIVEADKGESEEISDRNMKMWEEIFKAESEDNE